MMLMKVGLLGLYDDYDRFRGYGIQRYMHEMHDRMRHNKLGIQIEKAGYKKPMPFVGAGISFMLGNMLVDFGGYNIIHNMDQKPLIPLRKGDATLLTTVHDFQPILAPHLNDTTPKERVWQLLINYGMKMSLESDYLIARSSLTMSDAVRLGYERRKITVISDGVDERYLAKIPKKNQKRIFSVGYVGAFRKRKNVDFAIRAFRHIKDANIHLDIYGKQEFGYGKLVAEAAGNKLVHFRGFAPEDKIVNIYDSFDAFVFPSLYEGFGIPIIEAQSRGLPVIIHKRSKIPEEVRRYCIEAEDEAHMAEIVSSLKQNGYSESKRKKSTEYARSFTWMKEAAETLRLYKKIG